MSAGSSVMAEDLGNSYMYVVGVPPDDDHHHRYSILVSESWQWRESGSASPSGVQQQIKKG